MHHIQGWNASQDTNPGCVGDVAKPNPERCMA